MKKSDASGTEGYAEAAEFLVTEWQKISFADQHQTIMHLLPSSPVRVLDLGSGIGRDAAAFAAMGHQVVAVEPTSELRLPGMNLHDASNISWLDDSLPDLAIVRSRHEHYELIMLTAVWMHLDVAQRRRAMPVLVSLLQDTGWIIMSLRHGSIPEGRRMFDVSAEETIALAAEYGLVTGFNMRTASVQKVNQQNQVAWTRLAFRKATNPEPSPT